MEKAGMNLFFVEYKIDFIWENSVENISAWVNKQVNGIVCSGFI